MYFSDQIVTHFKCVNILSHKSYDLYCDCKICLYMQLFV